MSIDYTLGNINSTVNACALLKTFFNPIFITLKLYKDGMEVSQKIYFCHLKIKKNQYLAKYKFSSDNVRKAKFGDSKINSLSPFYIYCTYIIPSYNVILEYVGVGIKSKYNIKMNPFRVMPLEKCSDLLSYSSLFERYKKK